MKLKRLIAALLLISLIAPASAFLACSDGKSEPADYYLDKAKVEDTNDGA